MQNNWLMMIKIISLVYEPLSHHPLRLVLAPLLTISIHAVTHVLWSRLQQLIWIWHRSAYLTCLCVAKEDSAIRTLTPVNTGKKMVYFLTHLKHFTYLLSNLFTYFLTYLLILSKTCILHCLVLLNGVLFKPCLFWFTYLPTYGWRTNGSECR